jgi:ADP-ribose pyrophosphatase
MPFRVMLRRQRFGELTVVSMPLPPFPETTLVLVDETRAIGAPGFVTLRRQKLRARFPDGLLSDPFTYDSFERTLLDAVVIVAHFTKEGTRFVYLRTAVRPPLLLRSREAPVVELPTLGILWEVPAGLVEEDEQTADGLYRCAARELHEELGIEVALSDLHALGPPTFPFPGSIGERQFFFHVEVDPAKRGVPTEDGSALEREAVVAAIPLHEALQMIRAGLIEDAKTEIALRRLAEV